MADLPWVETFSLYGTTYANMAAMYTSLTNTGILSATSGRGARYGCTLNSGQGFTKTFSASYARWVIGAAIKFTSLASGQAFRLTDGGTNQVEFGLNADGTLKLTRNNTLLGSSVVAINANSFYYIELDVTIGDGTAGSFEIMVNETAVKTMTGIDTQNTANASANQFVMVPTGFGIVVCDLVIQAGPSAAYWGDVKLEAKATVSDGSLSQWPASTGSDKFAVVDDAATDTGMSDYISSGTPGQRQTFGFAGLSTGAGSVKAVRLVALADKDDAGTTRQIELSVRNGSTNYDSGSVETLTYGSALYYGHTWETNPATSAAWTLSEASNVEAGVELVA